MSKVKKDPPKNAKSKVKGWIRKTGFIESVMVDSIPEFIGKNVALNKMLRMKNIQTSDGVIKPLERIECGYMPYEYTLQKIQSLFDRKITREEIIEDVLSQVKMYIDLPLHDQILMAGNIIISYSL